MKRALRAWPTLPRAPPFTELAWPRTGLPTRAESRLSRSLRRSLTPTDKMQVEQKFLSHCSEPPGALLKCSVCLGRAGVRDSAFVLVKNFLIMESSTGFGAKDAKLRVTRSLATSRGLGSEGHGRPSRPAPPLPTPRLPEGARGVGHLLPAAGTRRLTPHPRPPARSASPLAPRGVPATPPPALRTAGTVAPAPPASAPSSRRITGALEPAGWGAPARGGSLRALPEPGAGGPLPRRTRLIHAKLIPAASRPPARGRAPALAEPRSLHPPPPPPPGGGVPGARPAKCQLPGRRGAAGPGPRRPPGPLHFYRRGRRARPGRRVPASRARAPDPLRAAALLRPRRPRRVCQPVTWFPLRPARALRLARRRPGAGRPDSSRGAARKWPPGRAPRALAGPRRPRPRRARRAPRPRAPGPRLPAHRLRTCRPRCGRPRARSGPCPPPRSPPPAAMSRPFWWPRVHPPGCVRREVRAWASFL
ncbi:unnamed protein product [Rangifer tarandus platyrhynchus]|uniref:Basic proline-rich protein-like n=1 Tax=Rangifer tarandus platyrhynchus TaxID=3082113 RepID=A0ABN8ZFW9_RANTA|nr:unnamed protein product [Rangifer tarandus platyrhynchus]